MPWSVSCPPPPSQISLWSDLRICRCFLKRKTRKLRQGEAEWLSYQKVLRHIWSNARFRHLRKQHSFCWQDGSLQSCFFFWHAMLGLMKRQTARFIFSFHCCSETLDLIFYASSQTGANDVTNKTAKLQDTGECRVYKGKNVQLFT